MKIIKAKDYKDMSRKAANIISAQVIIKPDAVLGLATGGTPVGTYAQLVEWYNKGDIDFSGVTTVNLDEYRDWRAGISKVTGILCMPIFLIMSTYVRSVFLCRKGTIWTK